MATRVTCLEAKLRRRKRTILELVVERGEVSRSELLEQIRSMGMAERDDTGAQKVKAALFRLRREGQIDYDLRRVWSGRNPDRAENLSTKNGIVANKIESESKQLIRFIFQAFASRRQECTGEGFCKIALAG